MNLLIKKTLWLLTPFLFHHCTFLKGLFSHQKKPYAQRSTAPTDSLDYQSDHTSQTFLWKQADPLQPSHFCFYRDFVQSTIETPYESLMNSRPLTNHPISKEQLTADLLKISDLTKDEISSLLEDGFRDFSLESDQLATLPAFEERRQLETFLLLQPQKFAPSKGISLRKQHKDLTNSKISMLLSDLYKRFLQEEQTSQANDNLCQPGSGILTYVLMKPDLKGGSEDLFQIQNQPCEKIKCEDLFVREGDRVYEDNEYARIYCEALKSDLNCYETSCQPCPNNSEVDWGCLKARETCPGYQNLIQSLVF